MSRMINFFFVLTEKKTRAGKLELSNTSSTEWNRSFCLHCVGIPGTPQALLMT